VHSTAGPDPSPYAETNPEADPDADARPADPEADPSPADPSPNPEADSSCNNLSAHNDRGAYDD
jgi:hypothetical protein